MRGRRRFAAGCLLAAATFCAACGVRERPVPDGSPRPRWVSEREAARGDFQFGIAGPHRELAILDLPQAGFPGVDAPRIGWTQVIVNVESNGSLYFRGETIREWGPDEKGASRIQDELRRSMRGAPPRTSLVNLRADRTTRWDRVRLLVILGASEQRGPMDIRFSLRDRDGRGRGHDAALDVTGAPGPPIGDGAVALGLRGSGRGVAIDVGKETLPFGPGDPLSDEPSALAGANRAWDRIETLLRESNAKEARLRIADEVPWAYVAQTLSLLLEVGIPRVEIAGLAAPLTLRAPAGRRDPLFLLTIRDDWPVPLATGLGLFLGAAAVGLPMLLARRRPRRGPATSSPRSPAGA